MHTLKKKSTNEAAGVHGFPPAARGVIGSVGPCQADPGVAHLAHVWTNFTVTTNPYRALNGPIQYHHGSKAQPNQKVVSLSELRYFGTLTT